MMTMTPDARGLPDPDLHAEFYADVSAKRLVAWIADSLVIAVLTLMAIPFTAFTALFFLPFFWLLIGLVYRIVTLARSSATPGMRLVAIEMRTARGERFDTGTAAMHTLLYSISIGMVVVQAVSIVLMLTSARRQGLPDHILGTVAINRAAAT